VLVFAALRQRIEKAASGADLRSLEAAFLFFDEDDI
jgi:hypothetical protein